MATSEVGDTLGPLTGPTSSAGSSTQSGASTRPLTGPQSAPARPVRLSGIGIGVPQGQHAEPGFGARTKSSVQAEVHETTGVWPHVIAICLLAYVGVLTRVVLEKATDRFHTANPCTDIRAPASQESELFNGLECAGQLGAGYWLPNIVGCIVMGIFLRVSQPLTKKWPVLYTGVTTGFCGCCTTFATWNHDIATAILTTGDVAGSLVNLVIHVIVCLTMLKFGQHLGSLFVSTRLATESVAREKAKFEALVGNALTYLDKTEASKPPAAARSRRRLSESNLSAAGMSRRSGRTVSYHEPVTTQEVRLDQLRGLISQAADEFSKSYFEARETALYPPSYTDQYRARVRTMHRCLAVALLVVTVAVWVLAFTVTSPATQAVFLKMALGPWGALIRYYTSLYNKRPTTACGGKELFNVATWHFPLYTFLVNVGGTTIDAVLTVVGRGVSPSSQFYSLWSPSIETGFCGSLSTVSTFMTETHQFKERRYAYRYVLLSFIVAQALALLIMGLNQPFPQA